MKITLSNKNGDTLHQISVKADPTHLLWSSEEKIEKLIVILNKKSVMLLAQNLLNPIEFSMNSRYGAIQNAFSYSSGANLLLGFNSGYLVSISLDQNSMGQELYQGKIYKSSMNALFISSYSKRCVSCGDNDVKVQDLGNLQVTSWC